MIIILYRIAISSLFTLASLLLMPLLVYLLASSSPATWSWPAYHEMCWGVEGAQACRPCCQVAVIAGIYPFIYVIACVLLAELQDLLRACSRQGWGRQ